MERNAFKVAKMIANTSINAAFIVSRDRRIMHSNKAATSTFGFGKIALRGKRLETLISKDCLPKCRHILKRTFEEPGEFDAIEFEVMGVRSDGTEFCAEVGISRLKNKKYMHLVVFSDISEARAREEGLRVENNAEKKANHAKSQFLANMSHELRTPLHVIKNFAHLAQKRLESATAIADLEKGTPKIDAETKASLQTWIAFIEKSQERQLQLINNLLDLAKLEAGQHEYFFEEVSLGDIIKAEAACMKSLIMENNLLVDIAIIGEHKVRCDRDKMSRVVQNLLSNAIKFSNSGKKISLSLKKGGDGFVCIEVSDEGCGIPKDELSLVFNRFAQSSRNKVAGEGTGLGLAICREIVTGHGGEISCANNDFGGAIFTVRLPLKRI